MIQNQNVSKSVPIAIVPSFQKFEVAWLFVVAAGKKKKMIQYAPHGMV
jgi:hypothetical protein